MAQESLYHQAQEVITIPTATTVTGGAAAIYGSLTLNDFAMIAGMVGIIVGLIFQLLNYVTNLRKTKTEIEAIRRREAREELEHQKAMKAHDDAARLRKKKDRALDMLEEDHSGKPYSLPDREILHGVFADTDVPRDIR
jgi:hypothetical protein